MVILFCLKVNGSIPYLNLALFYYFSFCYSLQLYGQNLTFFC